MPNIPLMNHVSRPLLGLLVATVVFFALWIVALKPSSPGTPGNSGLGQYQSAVNEAKASAASQDRAAAAGGNTVAGSGSTQTTAAKPVTAAVKPGATAAVKPAAATTAKPAATAAVKPATAAKPPTTAKRATTAKPATHAATATKPGARAPAAARTRAATPTQRLKVVDRALADHRVLALLFYNPAASDDQAVKRELQTVPSRGGRVVKLAIPLAEVANYPVVTTQVLIQSSPTLVIIDSARQAFTLVGFSSAFEIAHRVGDALKMR